MTNMRLAGHLGNDYNRPVIDEGTMCRASSPTPGYASPLLSRRVANTESAELHLGDGKFDVSDELAYAWLRLFITNAGSLPREDAGYYAVCATDLRQSCEAGPAPAASGKFMSELGNTLGAPTNLPGNLVGGATTAWSAVTAGRALTVAEAETLRNAVAAGHKTSLKLANGGTAELYDANAAARRAAKGNAGRAKYPPKMRIRLKGVPAANIGSAIPIKGGLPRIDATQGAFKKLTQKVSVDDWARGSAKGLPLRKLVTGNAIGFTLAVGPQAYSDWNASDGDWRKFAVASAGSQPGNVAGFAASVLVVAGVGTVVVLSAPVAIGLALVAGVVAQTGFNAAGGGDFVQSKVEELLK